MDGNSIILFDGVCNLCTSSVQFIIKHDPRGKFSFASLQSESGQEVLKNYNLPVKNFNTFLLIENGKVYRRSTAALRVARRLSGASKVLYTFIIVPPFIRDRVYSWIATNRYKWFGRQDTCMVPTPSLMKRFI